MIWIDYSIQQVHTSFKILGDYEGEVMGLDRDGNPRDHWLYKPGDVFVVDENGWFRKTDEVNAILMKYEDSKIKSLVQHNAK